MNVTMTLNGAQRAVAVEPDETLLAVLRRLGLRSVRETCGIGVCGSCTVLVDGRAMTGCLLLAPLVDGSTVVTAEGLADDPVVAAFADSHAYQCGWCIPGFVVAARGLLDENPAPNEHDEGGSRREPLPLRLVQDPRRSATRGGGEPVKLVTYEAGHGPRVGLLDGESIVDVGFEGDMVAFIEAGAPVGERTTVAGGRVLAPLRPRSLRDFLTFKGHLDNVMPRLGRDIAPEWFDVPAYYKGCPTRSSAPKTRSRGPCTRIDSITSSRSPR